MVALPLKSKSSVDGSHRVRPVVAERGLRKYVGLGCQLVASLLQDSGDSLETDLEQLDSVVAWRYRRAVTP